ncbi:MAG TPA: hypothetical protein VFF65_12830 [Phycisphaerales bacterium]|nr:hypothetical protein [Phycisphaerales bacterium]
MSLPSKVEAVLDAAAVAMTRYGRDAALDNWERHAMGFPQVPLQTRHRFAPGIYGREMTAPADTFLTGRVHRTEHLFVLSKGAVAVIRNGVREVLRAPYAGVNFVGTRQFGYVLEEMVWETLHHNPDNLRDVDELERLIFEPVGSHLDGLTAPSPEAFALLQEKGLA